MNEEIGVFSNPDNLPVEDVVVTVNNAGIIQKVKALDPFWVEKRELTEYERPPIDDSVFGAIDDWLLGAATYLEDLQWLLSLEYHRFWSTVIYDPECMESLFSFLQEANPPYLPPYDDSQVQAMYADIRKYVLIVFSRLITNKESKSQWMTKEHMASVLYCKFIFTIPSIWDICLIYGVDNKQHVSKLVSSVFALQPKYKGDCAIAVTFVKETFKYIILQVNKDYDSEEPPNLPETFEGFSEIPRPSNSETDKQESLTIDTLRDLVIHMLDTAMTLRIFIEVYSKAVEIYRKTNFVTSIVQLYEYGIPPLYEKLQELNDSSPECAEIEVFIDSARAELIDIFREILAVYKNNIFNGEGNISQHVESYLTVLLEGFTERLLVRDYNVCYPLHEDIEMLKQAYPEIDVVKTSFILRAINTNLSDSSSETSDDVPNGPVDTTEQKYETPETYNNTPGPSGNNQDTQIPHHVREQSLISEVRDILPELGDGFILKCLQYYDFKVDKVINSYLEDNLAEPLKGLDKSLPIIPEDPLDVKFLETGVERLNVFDGDAFDIMSRDDIDTSKVHIGKKKSKYKDAKDLLDDKSELQKIRERYNKYNLICAEEDALYDDEYDDTYDSDGMGPTTDTIDELEDRPFETPRVLLRRGRRAEEECESSSEEEEQPSTSISTPNTSYKNRVDFCVNPALMRARREANLQARKDNRAPPPPRKKDVVGKPKGQGQEKEVLQNRNRKEQHKSSRANHNRRQGAQWKRSQGMMPS